MSKQNVTLNLTPFFAIWTAIFVALGVVSGDYGLFWVAAIPWIIWFALVGLLFLFAMGVIGIAYLFGQPVTLTTPRKGTRVVQRGRR